MVYELWRLLQFAFAVFALASVLLVLAGIGYWIAMNASLLALPVVVLLLGFGAITQLGDPGRRYRTPWGC